MAVDLLTDDIGEFQVKDGDFISGFSDAQHIEDTMFTSPADLKKDPVFGIGIRQFINSPFTSSTRGLLKKRIRLTLTSDNVSEIKINYGDELEVSGQYAD